MSKTHKTLILFFTILGFLLIIFGFLVKLEHWHVLKYEIILGGGFALEVLTVVLVVFYSRKKVG
jgi:hypothetical protein